MASSRLAIGVFATSDWRSLQQRVALPVFQRMLLFGKTRLTDCLDRERVSFSASQLRNSHVKKLDNTSHTYEIDFADQNLWAEASTDLKMLIFFKRSCMLRKVYPLKCPNELYTLDRWLSRLQMTMWSQIAPQPENISPKGVCFSDLICIFAMSYQSFACFLFATLR